MDAASGLWFFEYYLYQIFGRLHMIRATQLEQNIFLIFIQLKNASEDHILTKKAREKLSSRSNLKPSYLVTIVVM